MSNNAPMPDFLRARGAMPQQGPVADPFSRAEHRQIVELGRQLDKLVEDFALTQANQNIVLKPQVMVAAFQYVVDNHNNRVNAIGDNVLQSKAVARDLKVEYDEPHAKEAGM